MVRTIIFVVAVLAPGLALGGGWVRQTDGTFVNRLGQAVPEHIFEWAECYGQMAPPTIYELLGQNPRGTTPDGLTVSWVGNQVTWYSDAGYYYAQLAPFIGRPDIPCAATEGTGFWVWRVSYTDTFKGLPVSYWGSPGALDNDRFANPLGVYPTDAGDAGQLFYYWGTPVGDFTGDGMTDAADAGALFEQWTGDAAPAAAVPEPGCCWLLCALLVRLLHERNNV